MESYVNHTPRDVPRQLRRATEPGIEPTPPLRDKGDRAGTDECGISTTEWYRYKNFQVRVVYHPGPPTPERRAFFRKLLFGRQPGSQ